MKTGFFHFYLLNSKKYCNQEKYITLDFYPFCHNNKFKKEVSFMSKNQIHSPEYLQYLNSLPKSLLLKVLENLYTEVYVTDKDGKIIYVNPMSLQLYGEIPEKMIGKDAYTMGKGRWNICALPKVMREKRRVFTEHEYFYLGKKVISVGNPIFDANGDIEMVVSTINQIYNHFDLSERIEAISNSILSETINSEYLQLSEEVDNKIIGNSPIFSKLLLQIQKAARSEVPILLLGESGTGKSLLAKYIHDHSPRSKHPFVIINCAAIPENLLESELFGYEPHAFTGASSKGKDGLLSLADGGTIFLDEIGDMSLPLQAKLLDVLENKRFFPVGSNTLKTVDIRIVTATNRNIEQMVFDNLFREDLFWRITPITLELPPLRKRTEDILPLCIYYLNKYNQENRLDKSFSYEILPIIINYSWPGNIRELKNTIQRCVVMSEGPLIILNDLPRKILDSTQYDYSKNKIVSNISGTTFDQIMDSIKHYIVNDIYSKTKSSRKFAEKLGLSQSTASRLIKKYIKT